MLSATGDLAERSVAPPLDLRQRVRYRQGFVYVCELSNESHLSKLNCVLIGRNTDVPVIRGSMVRAIDFLKLFFTDILMRPICLHTPMVG